MTKPPSDGSHALYARIASVAEVRGDAPAILYGARAVTYRALLEQAHAIAVKLGDALGTGSHRLVAVLGTPSPAFIAAMLGVLEHGWTYLPLDANHPRRRNDAILDDAKVDATIELGADGSAEITVATGERLAAETRAQLRDRVYVIYTSGSTGAPKGSASSVAAVLNIVEAMRAQFAFTADSAILGVTNFAWDLSVVDIYLTLTTGGRLVLLPPDEHDEPLAYARALERHGVDLVQASPSLWKMMIDAGWAGRPTLTAISGGEALPSNLAHAMIPRCRELWNFYGPVECTVWSTFGRVTDPDRITLGVAVQNLRVHLLRDDGTLASPGAPGEIAISGVGVANGYLHRPELTRERFISIATPTGELAAYRTGDLGQITETGEVVFLGRGDLMLKIRGHRVEAREVEVQLEHHPAIHQAVVFGRGGGVSDTLCAVLVTSEPLTARAVRDHLHDRVPDFMIPTEIALRDELPLNTNLKTDRRRVIDDFHASTHRAVVAPRDVFELELLQMITEVSGIPVGLDDPLFDGALHSLAVLSLVHRINRRLDSALTFAEIKATPTVTQLAAHLRRARSADFQPLIKLKDGTTRRSLVLFHSGGGTCLPYKPLVDRLPDELTVYGIECPNLYRQQPELFTVEEMTERYYADVMSIAADGPIALGGWSLGGYIAYETARRMRAEGREVGLVLLLDSVVMDDELLELARRLGKPNTRELLPEHFGNYWDHLDEAERTRLVATVELSLDAMLAYKPGRYDGDITIAKAGKFDDHPPDTDLGRLQDHLRSLARNGWEISCTGQIHVYSAPGTHNDIVSEVTAPTIVADLTERLGLTGSPARTEHAAR